MLNDDSLINLLIRKILGFFILIFFDKFYEIWLIKEYENWLKREFFFVNLKFN